MNKINVIIILCTIFTFIVFFYNIKNLFDVFKQVWKKNNLKWNCVKFCLLLLTVFFFANILFLLLIKVCSIIGYVDDVQLLGVPIDNFYYGFQIQTPDDYVPERSTRFGAKTVSYNGNLAFYTKMGIKKWWSSPKHECVRFYELFWMVSYVNDISVLQKFSVYTTYCISFPWVCTFYMFSLFGNAVLYLLVLSFIFIGSLYVIIVTIYREEVIKKKKKE